MLTTTSEQRPLFSNSNGGPYTQVLLNIDLRKGEKMVLVVIHASGSNVTKLILNYSVVNL